MALVTKTQKPEGVALSRSRHSDVSDSGVALTVSPPVGKMRRLLFVTVKYSAVATVNVLVTLNSGAGAAYDAVLQTIVLTGVDTAIWIPDGDVWIQDDDVLDVLAPLLAAQTSQVAVYTEEH